MTQASQLANEAVSIEIGGMAIALRTQDPPFRQLLETRYAGFTKPPANPQFEFEIDLFESRDAAPDEDLRVQRQGDQWLMRRGDFHAEWDSRIGRGHIRQSRNPYAVDSVLRIVHTLILAKQGGFLVHAASAIRNGRAFLFAGVSGAGKTTISRLAPADATLLTDEISYVRKLDVPGQDQEYVAFGTPFTGELAKLGENTSAPVAALYLLAQGPKNRIDPVGEADAGRELLANMLFFAEDQEMVHWAFQAACDFVRRVPVYRLTFVPDTRVWEMIG